MIMKKKILVIAPNSFPINSAEAIVNIKLLRYLQEAYDVYLISKQLKWKQYPSTELKESGLKLKHLEVISVENKITLKTIWLHLLALLRFKMVYKGAHWAYLASVAAEKICHEEKIDAVLTKSYPSELVGYYLKKKYNKKWLATWNDPFPMEFYPHPYGDGPQAKMSFLKRPLLGAMEKWPDANIFPNERLKNYMKQYLPALKNEIIIPHIAQRMDLPEHFPADTLHIIHSGDVRPPRDPRTFCQALSLFLEEHPEAKICVTFQGLFSPELSELIQEYHLQKHIRFIDPIPYTDSLLTLANYHVVLIIEAPCQEGIFLPTKVGDYIGCGKYIFTVSPKEGVLSDLYKEGYIQYFSPVTDVAHIKETLQGIYNNFTSCNWPQKKWHTDYDGERVLETYKSLIG